MTSTPGLILLYIIFAGIFVVAWLAIGRRYSQADWGPAWLNALDGWLRLFCRIWHRLEFHYLDLPESGPAIVVSNHVSGLDPLLMLCSSRRPLRFMVAKEEYNRLWLKWVLKKAGAISVDRNTRPDKALLKAEEALRRGEVVALFPHGGILERDSDPMRIKKGAVRLAQSTGCNIYPIHVDGMKAKGATIIPVFLPSKASVEIKEVLNCRDRQEKDCNDCLAELINNGTRKCA